MGAAKKLIFVALAVIAAAALLISWAIVSTIGIEYSPYSPLNLLLTPSSLRDLPITERNGVKYWYKGEEGTAGELHAVIFSTHTPPDRIRSSLTNYIESLGYKKSVSRGFEKDELDHGGSLNVASFFLEEEGPGRTKVEVTFVEY